MISRNYKHRILALFVIGLVGNENEMNLAIANVSDFQKIQQVLLRALKSDHHRDEESEFKAHIMLEGIAILMECSEKNVDFVTDLHIPNLFGEVISGPLHANVLSSVKPGEYKKKEKENALRCCYTLSFKPQGRTAIAALPSLAVGMFSVHTIQFFNTILKVCIYIYLHAL